VGVGVCSRGIGFTQPIGSNCCIGFRTSYLKGEFTSYQISLCCRTLVLTSYSSTDNKYKLMFQMTTTVQAYESGLILLHGFNFTDIY